MVFSMFNQVGTMIFKDEIKKLNSKLKYLDTISAVLSFITVVIIFIEVRILESLLV